MAQGRLREPPRSSGLLQSVGSLSSLAKEI